MKQYANEKQFDERLKRIDYLYETGKDLILILIPPTPARNQQNVWESLYEVLREMRDIAATSLVANHEIKSN